MRESNYQWRNQIVETVRLKEQKQKKADREDNKQR